MNFLSIKVILIVSVFFVCFGFTVLSSKSEYKVDLTISNAIVQDTTKKDSIVEIPITLSEKPKETEQTFSIVEKPANYPDGGMDGFYKYISKNLVYPKEAKKKKIEGRVFVQFIVDKEGKITEVKTVKGIGGGCDEEAERLLRESKDWIPAQQRGKTVKVRMNIPIVFKLDK